MPVLGREQWTFSILSGGEVAQCGWALLAAATTDVSDVVSAIDAVTDPWAGARDRFPTTTSVVARKFLEMDPSDGHVIAQHNLAVPGSPAGSGSSRGLPPQCSEVISIVTATTTRRGRGRIYLPAVTIDGVNDASRIDSTVLTDLITSWGGYFNGLSEGTLDVELGVWSQMDLGFHGWTRVDMGNVFDTQRNRRSSLSEARTFVDHS